MDYHISAVVAELRDLGINVNYNTLKINAAARPFLRKYTKWANFEGKRTRVVFDIDKFLDEYCKWKFGKVRGLGYFRRREKPKCVVCDLDGTFFNTDEILNEFVIGKETPDWQGFQDNLHRVTLNEWCRELLRHYDFGAGATAIFITARDKATMPVTVRMLDKYCTMSRKYKLYMRYANDSRSQVEIKKEIFLKHVYGKYDVLLAIDDNPDIVKMYKELGVPCVQCFPNVVYRD